MCRSPDGFLRGTPTRDVVQGFSDRQRGRRCVLQGVQPHDGHQQY